MFRVIEVAAMLGVSKVTIYKKIKNNPDIVDGIVIKKNNIMYITSEGIEVIEDLLDGNSRKSPSTVLEERFKTYLADSKIKLEKDLMAKKESIGRKDLVIKKYKERLKRLDRKIKK